MTGKYYGSRYKELLRLKDSFQFTQFYLKMRHMAQCVSSGTGCGHLVFVNRSCYYDAKG